MTSHDPNPKPKAAHQSQAPRLRAICVACVAVVLIDGLLNIAPASVSGRTAESSAVAPAEARPLASSLTTNVKPGLALAQVQGSSSAKPELSAEALERLAEPRRIPAKPWVESKTQVVGDGVFRPALEPASTRQMEVTAYSPHPESCGEYADGITASGYSVFTNGFALVAADPSVLPLGSWVSIPGYDEGRPVPVLDVGGAIQGDRLDVLFADHASALAWGRQNLEITIWQPTDRRAEGAFPSDGDRNRLLLK